MGVEVGPTAAGAAVVILFWVAAGVGDTPASLAVQLVSRIRNDSARVAIMFLVFIIFISILVGILIVFVSEFCGVIF